MAAKEPEVTHAITVGGDKVKGMKGTETVYGPAVVGGDKVTYETKKDNGEQFMSVQGERVHFPSVDEDEQLASKKEVFAQKKTWVDNNDDGDEDEEVRRMRLEMKNGVLAYDNYMNHKHEE